MKLRFLGGPQQGRVIDLVGGQLTFGRGAENDVVLDGDGVSRRHCRIIREGETYSVEDVQSTNGVRLNGRRIAVREALRPGDHVGIGPHVLQFFDEDAVLKPPPPPQEEPPPLPVSGARRPFPLVQAGLLLLLLALFGGLVWLTLRPPSAPPPAKQPVPSAVTVPDPAAPDAGEVAETAPARLPEITPPKTEPAEPPPSAGVLLVNSDPVGAAVQVDGKAIPGVTPVMAPNLAPGRHTLTLTLRGYEPLTRLIQFPAAAADKPYALRQKPGTLRITSTPVSATVQYGPRILGQTPLLLDDLKPGSHEFTVSLAGYDAKTAAAEVAAEQPAVLDVVLESRMGSLEVITTPPGCDIYSGASLLGQTVAGPEGGASSVPLAITGIAVGEHEIVARHVSGATARARAKITSQDPCRITLAPWVPDTELKLASGGVRCGVLKETSAAGDVTLGFPSNRSKRYGKAVIASSRTLPSDEVRDLISRMAAGSLADELEPSAGSGAAEEAALYTAEKLQQAAATLQGQAVRIRGVPISFGRTGGDVCVSLTGGVRCMFPADAFQAVRKVVLGAQKARQPVTVQGIVGPAVPGEGVILGGASLVF